MALPKITTTCDCGTIVEVHAVPHNELLHTQREEYAVCDLECPSCRRRSSGGNYITGEVSGWNTPEVIAHSQAIYEQQMFESDMNEWYGRGEW